MVYNKICKRFLLCILAVVFLLIPTAAIAAGEEYLAFGGINYSDGNELYHNIISTSDGGYAVTLSVGKDGYIYKYNADGTRAFNYKYTVPDQYWYYSSFGTPVAQTADGGYVLAAYGGMLIKLSPTGAEEWQKQVTDGVEIYEISVSSTGNMLLRISEKANSVLSDQIWCVDAAGNVKWKKSRDDFDNTYMYTTFSSMVSTLDGNFVAILNDAERHIIAKFDNEGGVIWQNDFNANTLDPSNKISFEDVKVTQDGGLVMVGRDDKNKALISKFDSNGQHQWSNSTGFSYYKMDILNSVIETDEGYLAVGSSKSFDLMPKEDLMSFYDTLIVRYDKSGNVISGGTFFEGFDMLKTVVTSGEKYLVLGMTRDDYYQLAKKPTGLMTFTKTSTQPKTGWEKRGEYWYYRKDGLTVRGWQNIGGNGAGPSRWYWMRPNGVMATGWIREAYKNWYYMQPNGAMATGWVRHSNAWYYTRSNGTMATGWIKDKNSWYYLSGGTASTPVGQMQTGWLNDGGKWYYLKPNGAMATGRYTINGRASNFSAGGVWQGYVK